MAARVGSLRVDLVANSQRFNAGLRGAGRMVGAFRNTIGRAARSLTSFGSAMTGVALGGGLVFMLKSQMKSIDQMAKFSDQIGINIEDLQKLRHAAELTGAGAQTLDAGLQTMAKRLGEAARGSGAAVPALKELGLTAKDLIRLSPGEAFREIAGALERIPEPMRRNAIAANLFSKANQKLINTLALGRGGLRQAGEELAQLGGVISRMDAAKIEAANDALSRMAQVIQVKLGTAVASVADDLEDATTAMTNFLTTAIRTWPYFKKMVGHDPDYWKIAAMSPLSAMMMGPQFEGAMPTGMPAPTADPKWAKLREGFFAKQGRFPETTKELLDFSKGLLAASGATEKQIKAGQRLFDLTRTPLEKLKSDVGDWKGLLGVKATTPDVYGRLMAQGRERIGKMLSPDKATAEQFMVRGGLQRGTQAAARAEMENRFNRTQQMDRERERTRLLRDINRILTDIEENTRPAEEEPEEVIEG